MVEMDEALATVLEQTEPLPEIAIPLPPAHTHRAALAPHRDKFFLSCKTGLFRESTEAAIAQLENSFEVLQTDPPDLEVFVKHSYNFDNVVPFDAWSLKLLRRIKEAVAERLDPELGHVALLGRVVEQLVERGRGRREVREARPLQRAEHRAVVGDGAALGDASVGPSDDPPGESRGEEPSGVPDAGGDASKYPRWLRSTQPPA